VSEAGSELKATLAETIDAVTVRPAVDGWVGDTPEWFGDRLFGGFVVAQAVHAATRGAPDGRRLHSLHGYFLRPVLARVPVSYRLTPRRTGRTFSVATLDAMQDGGPVFTMTCSFTVDTGGYEYELAHMPAVPAPDALEVAIGPGPWLIARVGPTEPAPDGTRASTHRVWLRIAGSLPDDPHLHAALIAFATDITGTGARPLHLEGDIRGIVSIDHAVWFHRALRADEWLFYDVHSLVNTGGRGLLRGTMHGPGGLLAVSVAQEVLLRPYA
jgi:acyl-CoA thioesterase-2